jgi:hypothetical protein
MCLHFYHHPLITLWLFLLVVDSLVDPFIAGTSGSDPDSVSVCTTLGSSEDVHLDGLLCFFPL